MKENTAFIDGQNLHLGTTKSDESWIVDFVRFREYLRAKYKVTDAYYYIGFAKGGYQSLYIKIQKAGFILVFKPHTAGLVSTKKGNVDSDIVFDIMRQLYKKELSGKVILVSGDGDYFKLVQFLLQENMFEKILFPSQKSASSLYKRFTSKYFDNLSKFKTVLQKQIKKGPKS